MGRRIYRPKRRVSGKVDLAPFITSRIVVDDLVEKGFERLITNKDNEVKILVSVH